MARVIFNADIPQGRDSASTLGTSGACGFDSAHDSARPVGDQVQDMAGCLVERHTALETVHRCGGIAALRFASGTVRSNREVVLAAVTSQGDALRYASDLLRADRAIVLCAVQNHGLALAHCSDPDLCADAEIAVAAAQQNGQALVYVAAALRADRTFMLEVLPYDGLALEHAEDDALREDHHVVLTAVRQCGSALRFAGEALRADKAVVMEAVGQQGGALLFAAPALRAMPAVVLRACEQDGTALQHAASELLADPALIHTAVRRARYPELAFAHCPRALKEDRGFVLELLASRRQHSVCFQHLEAALKGDRGFALEAIARNGHVLAHIDQQLLSDPSFVRTALAANGAAFQSLKHERQNVDLARVAVGALVRAIAAARPQDGFV